MVTASVNSSSRCSACCSSCSGTGDPFFIPPTLKIILLTYCSINPRSAAFFLLCTSFSLHTNIQYKVKCTNSHVMIQNEICLPDFTWQSLGKILFDCLD